MKTKKRAAAAALAVSLAAAFPLSGYADVNPIMGDRNSGGEESEGAGPSIDDQIGAVKPKDQLIDKELLSRNRLEYGEIGSRIEYFNKDYRNAKTQLLDAYLSLGTAGALTQEADELMEEAKDFKYDDMTPEDREYYEWYKDAVQELRRQAQKITNADLPGSAERTLRLASRNLTERWRCF